MDETIFKGGYSMKQIILNEENLINEIILEHERTMRQAFDYGISFDLGLSFDHVMQKYNVYDGQFDDDYIWNCLESHFKGETRQKLCDHCNSKQYTFEISTINTNYGETCICKKCQERK